MAKKNFAKAPKPANQPPDAAIEQFVQHGTGKDNPKSESKKTQTHKLTNVKSEEEPTEPIKRLSVDLPKSVHAKYKALCAEHDMNMTKDAQSLIEKRIKQLDS